MICTECDWSTFNCRTKLKSLVFNHKCFFVVFFLHLPFCCFFFICFFFHLPAMTWQSSAWVNDFWKVISHFFFYKIELVRKKFIFNTGIFLRCVNQFLSSSNGNRVKDDWSLIVIRYSMRQWYIFDIKWHVRWWLSRSISILKLK